VEWESSMRCLVVGTRNAGNADVSSGGTVIRFGCARGRVRALQTKQRTHVCVRVRTKRYCTRKWHNTQSGVVNNRAHCRGVSGGERDGHGLHEGRACACSVRRVRSENRSERYRRCIRRQDKQVHKRAQAHEYTGTGRGVGCACNRGRAPWAGCTRCAQQ
jgi:hypothetical protein